MKSLFFVGLFALSVFGKKAPQDEKPDWAKKDVLSYSDADLEKLLEQWDEDEEPIPPDELPEGHPDRPVAPVDFSKLDMNDPDAILQATKKGKTIMMFVKVNDFQSRDDTEEITALWQTGLYNNHIQAERFMLDNDRVMFMFRDGAVAFEAKDFLIEQERCEDVQMEQKTYLGKNCKVCSMENDQIPKDDPKPKKKKAKKPKKEDKKTEL